MIVADFSMKNGRENRNNGNQEKGKEEKEALRKSVRVKRGTPKASPKFLYASRISSPLDSEFDPRLDCRKDSGFVFPGLGTIRGKRKSYSEIQDWDRNRPLRCYARPPALVLAPVPVEPPCDGRRQERCLRDYETPARPRGIPTSRARPWRRWKAEDCRRHPLAREACRFCSRQWPLNHRRRGPSGQFDQQPWSQRSARRTILRCA